MILTRDSTDFMVYKMLLNSPLSGAEIAAKLSVSRAAVWKHVEKLRRYGVVVEARKGYEISSQKDPNPYAVAKAAFEAFPEIGEVHYYDVVDSTNEAARRERRENAVFFAERQTAGRGRRGRSWVSEPGGLYFSVTLKPDFEDVQRVTLAAGLAVARSVGGAIKWPNDVLIDGKKICGILCELAGSVEEPLLIVGIGINVRNPVPENAARLCDYSEYSIVEIFDKVMRNLRECCLAIPNRWPDMLDEVRSLCETLGRRVRVYTPSGVIEGVAEKIDDDGALVVDGIRVLAGDCVHLR